MANSYHEHVLELELAYDGAIIQDALRFVMTTRMTCQVLDALSRLCFCREASQKETTLCHSTH